MQEFFVKTNQNDVGTRIDKFLSAKFQNFTRTFVQNLIKKDLVTVDGMIITKNFVLKNSQKILVKVPIPVKIDILPEKIDINIVFEDEYLLIVNKPKGMVVHPAVGNRHKTLVNALLHHCGDTLSGINGKIRPGIVHRIDKDTSGLLIVAKNDFAHNFLARQIKEHTFFREYEAVVHGKVKNFFGKIDKPIGRHKIHRKKMAVTTQNAKKAVTHYEVLRYFENFTHLRLKLETGRTHQIRVHMAYIGHPVAGDAVYGPKKAVKSLGGQCLHAKAIGFIHPATREFMNFSSELPEYFTNFLKSI